MRGSIQKKGRIYYAVVAVGLKRKWFKGGTTKKDAEKVLTDKLGDIDNGTYKDIPKTTFEEYSKLWIGMHVEASLKPSTQKHYKDMMKEFTKAFEGKRLSDITTKQLQMYIVNRLKKVSTHTIQSDIMLIKLFFRHALKWGYLQNDPALSIDRPKYAKPEIDLLEPDEISRMLSQAGQETNPYNVAFRTAIETGLRAGELWGLQWRDIDWEVGKIHVVRSLWRGSFQFPKTKTAIRKVDISERLLTELKKWKLACPISIDDLVFPSPEGHRVNHENVMNRYFRPLLRRAGMRQVSFHSLRHSNASLRIAAGQNIKYLSTQLGHASIKITLDTYGHLFQDEGFTKQQVGLLELKLDCVRNPLETFQSSAIKVSATASNTLQLNKISTAGISRRST